LGWGHVSSVTRGLAAEADVYESLTELVPSLTGHRNVPSIRGTDLPRYDLSRLTAESSAVMITLEERRDYS
jgi:hypothetical protein